MAVASLKCGRLEPISGMRRNGDEHGMVTRRGETAEEA